MLASLRAPGVELESVFLQPEARLPTGVAGFAGFADAIDSRDARDLRPVALHHYDDFTRVLRSRADSHLGEAVAGFFRNGGVRCHVARADPAFAPEAALQQAVESLAPLEDIDLIAVPDAMTLRHTDVKTHDGAFRELRTDAIDALQRWMLDHCAQLGNRFAILDALPAHAGGPGVKRLSRAGLAPAQAMSGALYGPWLRVAPQRLQPPCGHVAGVYARSDGHTGVHKAPANEALQGVLDLESAPELPDGVNALRALRGRGVRVWGARTLSGDARWQHVNVRRLFIQLRRWIDRNMAWAAFEPAGPALWQRIERELGAYLDALWRSGALQGATPRQACYVKCDAETNHDAGRRDQVVTEIGLAPSLPAEFVVVRIVHRLGAAEDDQPD